MGNAATAVTADQSAWLGPQTGLPTASLTAMVARRDKEAKLRIGAFLDRKTAKVKPA